MDAFTDSDAANALAQLSQLTAERETELKHYAGATDSSSDAEESDSPVMDKFTAVNASTGLKEMINFGLSEFMQLWAVFGPFIASNWNTGRGRKSAYGGEVMLFMLLAVMKHGDQWSNLRSSFGVKE